MSYTTRSFTRAQVAKQDSVTSPVRVGPEGIVSVVIKPQSWDPKKTIGMGLQVNLSTDPSSNFWANLRNIGDPGAKLYKGSDFTGLMEMHIHEGNTYGFTNVAPGAWVRAFIYRLDKLSKPIDVAVRTSFGETFLETPVRVKNDVIETENENQWVSKVGDNA